MLQKKLIFKILFSQFLCSNDLGSQQFLSLPHVIRGVLWGVGTRIVKIRDRLSIEIAKQNFKKDFFCEKPFTLKLLFESHVTRNMEHANTKQITGAYITQNKYFQILHSLI